MKAKIDLVARILLGIMLLVSGLNKFIGFMPAPEFSAAAGKFFGALADTGYMIILIGFVEVVTGVLLLVNRYVALALVLLAPNTVNILLFHIFLDPANIVPGLILAVFQGYLVFVNKEKFKELLTA